MRHARVGTHAKLCTFKQIIDCPSEDSSFQARGGEEGERSRRGGRDE